MLSFRRVEDAQAGPNALGILVPPGRRTVVILRPRALEWDLLAFHPRQGFCQFSREEAAGVARRVLHALEQDAIHAVQLYPTVTASSYQAAIRIDDSLWMVCRRQMGRPYEPVHFPTIDEADRAVEKLLPFLRPAVDQEYYFNTQHFSAT